MDAKQFYEEHANNTWWNASTDTIEIKADDLWKLMDEYTMHLAKNTFSNPMLADSCRFYEQIIKMIEDNYETIGELGEGETTAKSIINNIIKLKNSLRNF